MAPTTSPLLKRFCFDALVSSYNGPQFYKRFLSQSNE